MIVRNLHGSGSDYGIATLNMLNDFKTLFIAYDNISFIERYTVNAENGICRDIYAISGFDKYYITLQNETNYNTNVIFRIVTRGNEHTETCVYESMWPAYGTLGANDTPIAQSKFYAISKNNVLKAFTLLDKEYSVSNQMVCFVTQDSNNYILYNNTYALVNNIQGNIYQVNTVNPSFNTNEKAIKKNLIITDYNSYNSLFIDIIDSMYYFINSQFASMTLALIQVGNKKYRQIYENCIFIEDGD